MTDNHEQVKEEAEVSHKETLELLKETTKSVSVALNVLSEARLKLINATIKYEERLNGPDNNRAG